MKKIERIKLLIIFSCVCACIAIKRGERIKKREWYKGDKHIEFHDPYTGGMFLVLEDHLSDMGIVVDRTKISAICLTAPMPMNAAGVYNKITGEIYIDISLLNNIEMCYWVMAHEVQHSQGMMGHDNRDPLMGADLFGYYIAIIEDQSMDSIIYTSYVRNLYR